MSLLNVTWVDSGREAQCPSDPRFPHGMDVDVSGRAIETCQTDLPYPADRCGYFVVKCAKCYQTVLMTTAGRADDPRSIKLACKYK